MKKIIILLICLLLCGCYNYHEIDDLAIIYSLGIDYHDNNYIVYIEYNTNSKEKENESFFYKGEDLSLNKAIDNAALKINKTLYFSDLSTLILSKNIINNKLDSVIDFITRDNNFAFNFNVLLSDDINALEKIAKDNKFILGKNLKELLNANNNIINTKYGDFLEIYLNKFYNIILPLASIKDNEIIVDKACLYKDKKIIYTLNNEEIQIYNLLTNINYEYLFLVNYQNKQIVFRVLNSKGKIKYKKNNITLTLSITGAFDEMENVNINDKKELNKIINKTKDTINNRINDFIKICLTWNVDPIGINKSYYNETKKELKNLNKLNYIIKSDILIDREGLIYNSIGDEFAKRN
jgi:spore germination protein KC